MNKFFYTLLILFCALHCTAQTSITGHIYFLNSKHETGVKVPATNVQVRADGSNGDYSKSDGAYRLRFPQYPSGKVVSLSLGNQENEITDGNGKKLEWVNQKELEMATIPREADEKPIDLIVCPKGYRDLAAQKYYNIIRTSADKALAIKEKEYNQLLSRQQKDYKQISALSAELAKLQNQSDSLKIYKEAFNIASINKDNASKRVLRYVQLLDEGKSIQEAREVLSVKSAASDLAKSALLFKASIKELETRAGASQAIFDFEDAIMCYDTIINYYEEFNIDKLELAILYLTTANVISDNGDYKMALDYQQKAIDILEKIVDPSHPYLASSFTNIGLTYNLLGQFDEALKYHQRAISIDKEILDAKDPHLAISYNNIALTYSSLGYYNKALDYQKRVIEIEEEVLGNQHPKLATSFNNIANSYRFLGKYKEALNYQRKAIAIQEEVLTNKHPDLAISFNNIATIYQSMAQYNKALEYQQKSIAIREEILNARHPDLAISYSNLALSYQSLAQYEKALEYQQKAISIQEEILDARHPDLSTSYNNLGNTYSLLTQYQEALIYQQKAIEIDQETLDPKHPNLANSFASLGNTYQFLAQFEKSIEYQEKAIAIREEVLDANHPDLGVSYNNIGITYQSIGKNNKALLFQQKAIDIREKILDANHPELAISYWSIAVTFKTIKHFAKAIEMQEKCLVIFKNALPKDHPYQNMAFITWLELYEGQASSAMSNRKYSAALNSLDTLIAHRNNFDDFNQKGLCHFYLKEYSSAIVAYNKAATLFPDFKKGNFHNNVGVAYARNKQFAEAKASLSEYEKLNPNESGPFRNWAIYYALKGDNKKAIQNLQKALELGYSNIDWLNSDHSFDGLRKEKEFKQLIKKMEDAVKE